MSFVQPAALSAVRAQIAEINSGINGGFAAVLASASGASAASPSATSPSTSGTGTEMSTALLTGAMNTSPGASTAPSSSAPAALSPLPAGPVSSAVGQAAVDSAENYLGVPYVWGGESPSGFDCSGLVQYVYRQVGIDLPRTSQEQATVGTGVPSLADARPGDLVFFAGSDGTDTNPGHVGIYIGNGEMIDAPYTGTDVQIQPVGDPVAIRDVSGLSSDTPALAFATTGSVPATTGSASSAGGQYDSVFAAATSRYGLPVGLLQAVAGTESGGNPSAVSGAGAEGIMQMMPSVAAGLGVDPFDPSQAIPAAAGMLSSYLQRFGSVPLALAAYNAGPGAVETYGGIPPFPQTVDYVDKVESLMAGAGPAPGGAGAGSDD